MILFRSIPLYSVLFRSVSFISVLNGRETQKNRRERNRKRTQPKDDTPGLPFYSVLFRSLAFSSVYFSSERKRDEEQKRTSEKLNENTTETWRPGCHSIPFCSVHFSFYSVYFSSERKREDEEQKRIHVIRLHIYVMPSVYACWIES